MLRCLLCGQDFRTVDWNEALDLAPDDVDDRVWIVMGQLEHHMVDRHAEAW